MRPLNGRAVALFGQWLGVAFVAALVVGAACGRTDLDFAGGAAVDAASASGGRDGSGGVLGTGGTRGTGGRSGSGGVPAGTGGGRPTGGSGGASTDGGAPDLAADVRPPDAPRPDSGAADAPRADGPGPDLPPSTPGTLVCGGQSCDTRSQSCCVSIAVGSVGAGCVPIGTSCGGIALACDEPDDCPGATCCFGIEAQQGGGGGLALGSHCVTRAACNGLGRNVVCRTNADCARPTPLCCAGSLGVPVCQRVCP